jgi:RNA polymerase sigma factor (sigma-70 family)
MINFNALPDEDLYGMCLEGDGAAWKYLYNYVLAICRWEKWDLYDEAEDLAQQIVLYLLEKAMPKVRERLKFRNFVKVVTINKIKDSFKRPLMESLDAPVFDGEGEEYVPDHADTGPLPDGVVMSLELFALFDEALAEFSSEIQRVVREWVKYKVGMYDSFEDLGAKLGMPVPTISSIVRRALDKLLKKKEFKEFMESWRLA